MKIIPVLDVMNGVVVRGIAGRRHEYRPIVSRLCAAPAPLAVARAFREHFGLKEIYLADLDALAGGPPRLELFAQLRAEGFRLWVDAGIRHAADAGPLLNAGVDCLVAGLETLAGPATLEELGRTHGRRIIFSLDLNDGRPLTKNPPARGGSQSHGDAAWPVADAFDIGRRAVALGAMRILVLDLRRVGTGAGTGTEDLCRRLATSFPQIELAAGGGIRGQADLDRLAAAGVHFALAASALHDGALLPQVGPGG